MWFKVLYIIPKVTKCENLGLLIGVWLHFLWIYYYMVVHTYHTYIHVLL